MPLLISNEFLVKFKELALGLNPKEAADIVTIETGSSAIGKPSGVALALRTTKF